MASREKHTNGGKNSLKGGRESKHEYAAIIGVECGSGVTCVILLVWQTSIAALKHHRQTARKVERFCCMHFMLLFLCCFSFSLSLASFLPKT
jgi:hypothetical protein